MSGMHPVRLKQCTTADVVSRLLKYDGELKGNRQVPVLSPKVVSTQQQTHSPRRGNGLDSLSRRSRVIEMGHSGAEMILSHERTSWEEPFQAAKIRMTSIAKQTLFPNTSRRYFHLENDDSRCQKSHRKNSEDEYSRLLQSISAVKASVEGNVASDVETATRNAGMSISRIFVNPVTIHSAPEGGLPLSFPFHPNSPATSARQPASCPRPADAHLKLQDWYTGLLLDDPD